MKNNYLYQGGYSEMDDDIGWNDFALRNYDAQIGRWVQQDPFQQFASPYIGQGGDPINLIDPSGGLSWPPPGLSGVFRIGSTTTIVGKVLDASRQSFAAISLLSKISIAISTVNAAVNIINSSINSAQVGYGNVHYTPGGQRMYFPDDNPEFFGGGRVGVGDLSIYPMKGTVRSFTVRGDDVADGAVRFVAQFNTKTGDFTGYGWDKNLDYSYDDFIGEVKKDMEEQAEFGDRPWYQHYNSPEEARKAFINFSIGVALPPPILKTATFAANAAKGVSKLSIRTDIVLSGGRSGQLIKTLTGPANSVVKGGQGRIFITDDAGKVIWDITKDRAKSVIPGQGFGPKVAPTQEQLNLLKQVWGN